MSNKSYHTTLALAGVCQSAMLVPQLGNQGHCSNDLYMTSVRSIFNMSPSSTEDVYGGIEQVRTGLQVLSQLFSSRNQEKMDIMRYTFSVLGVTHKLLKNGDALNKIAERLERVQILYPTLNDEVLNENLDPLSYSLAGIYSDIISPLTSKIRVTGKIDHLQNTLIQARVRTTLLGCVRSAILWYQVGGGRLQLLFGRKSMTIAANEMLKQINNSN